MFNRNVILSEFPQPEKLQQKLEEANVGHGQTVTANIKNVRLTRGPKRTLHLFFCPITAVEVLKKLGTPDGSQIPESVSMPDTIPVSRKTWNGYYDMTNVEIVTNGAIHLRATAETGFKLIKEDARPPARPFRI